MRTAVVYVLYWFGDWVSKVMCYFDWAWLYPIYNRLMLWSSDLDREGKVWTKNS